MAATGYDVVTGDSAPGSSVTNFSLMLSFDPSTSWWTAYGNGGSDPAKIAVRSSDGATEYPRDILLVSESLVQIRVGWSGAQSGTPAFRVEPDDDTTDHGDSDTYGRYNAYPSHLECYLTMDEASGTLVDRTNNSNDLTTVNTPTYGSTGKINKALTFDDASSEYAGRTSAVIAARPLTMMCWFNTNDGAATQCLMSLGNSADNNPITYMYLNPTGDYLAAQTRGDTGTPAPFSLTAASWTAGSWFHGAFVSASNTSHSLLLNAANKTTDTQNVPIGTVSRTGVGVLNRLSPVFYMSGLIDDAQFHSAALADAWIAYEYTITNDLSSFWSNSGWTAVGGGGSVYEIVGRGIAGGGIVRAA